MNKEHDKPVPHLQITDEQPAAEPPMPRLVEVNKVWLQRGVWEAHKAWEQAWGWAEQIGPLTRLRFASEALLAAIDGRRVFRVETGRGYRYTIE